MGLWRHSAQEGFAGGDKVTVQRDGGLPRQDGMVVVVAIRRQRRVGSLTMVNPR